MTESGHDKSEVDRFVLDEIDSVPHLEALMLVWNHRPKAWSAEEMSRALYIPKDRAEQILRDLVQRRMLGISSGDLDCYVYQADAQIDAILEATDQVYRKELVRLSTLIHSKGSQAMREFARAFRFRDRS